MLRQEPGAVPTERARAIELLDEFQAAERAGAEAVARWALICRSPALRAGLKMIAARNRGHAALAEARLRTLGGEPRAAASPLLAGFCALLVDPSLSDHAKLALVLARLPSQAGEMLIDFARRLEADEETRVMFETIADDEHLTLAWLHDIRARLEQAEAG
jgi:hypothetical protein